MSFCSFSFSQVYTPKQVVKSLPLLLITKNSKLLAPGYQCRLCLKAFYLGQHTRLLPCTHKVEVTSFYFDFPYRASFYKWIDNLSLSFCFLVVLCAEMFILSSMCRRPAAETIEKAGLSPMDGFLLIRTHYCICYSGKIKWPSKLDYFIYLIYFCYPYKEKAYRIMCFCDSLEETEMFNLT